MRPASLLTSTLLLLAIAIPTQAQQPSPWTYTEAKDDFTDKVTRILFVSDEKHVYRLAIANSGGTPAVVITLPVDMKLKTTISVQYRLDSGPVVEESWVLVDKSVGTTDARSFVRQLLDKQQLRIRMKSGNADGPTMTFNIRGLSSEMSKLGL